MKKMLIGLTGLLIVALITAFTLGSPDGGKEKKKTKEEAKKECVNTPATGCQGHAAMKVSCDPAKCQGTCDKTNCKTDCSGTCTTGTCDPAKCEKHAAMAKKQ